MAGIAVIPSGDVGDAGQGPAGVKARYPAAGGGVRDAAAVGDRAAAAAAAVGGGAALLLLLLLAQQLLLIGLLGGNGLLDPLFSGRQLLLVGGQGVLGGALGPLDLHDGRGVFLVELVQLLLVALQALLQLGYPGLLLLHLGALGRGVVHVLLELIHQLLVPLAHGVQQLGPQGELAEAVGIQQDLQGADGPGPVQGHHPLAELLDGAGHLLLGFLQLQGELVDALVELVDLLPGGVDLPLQVGDLGLQVLLFRLLVRLLLLQGVQLVLQLLVFLLQLLLFRLRLGHAVGQGPGGHHGQHAQGHQARPQPPAKAMSLHKSSSS